MNILLIHQYFLEKNHGGGSRFNEFVKIWSKMDCEITVLAGMVNYQTGKKLEKYKGKFVLKEECFYENVNVIRCHVSEKYNHGRFGRFWAYLTFIFSSLYAGLFMTKKKYDVILVSSPPIFDGITAYLLSIFKKTPFIYETRDLWIESISEIRVIKSKLILKFLYFIENFVFDKAILINVLTPIVKKKLILKKNISKNKLIYIPNSSYLDLIKQVEKKFDVQKFRINNGIKDKFVITYVGAHGISNNLIQLVDVAEKFRGENVIFQLIGDGMKKKYLQNEVIKRNLENVKFIDVQSKKNIFKYILASDVGVSILKKTNTFKTIYSNKTFDYMACKKPILLAIDGVSRKLINDAKCGVYVEPENIKSIFNGIKTLMNKSKYDLEKMGISGYEYSKKYFNKKELSKKYIKSISNFIKNYE